MHRSIRVSDVDVALAYVPGEVWIDAGDTRNTRSSILILSDPSGVPADV